MLQTLAIRAVPLIHIIVQNGHVTLAERGGQLHAKDYRWHASQRGAIMRRYERFSTLLTSNHPVEDWGKLLGDVAAR